MCNSSIDDHRHPPTLHVWPKPQSHLWQLYTHETPMYLKTSLRRILRSTYAYGYTMLPSKDTVAIHGPAVNTPTEDEAHIASPPSHINLHRDR